MHTFFLLLLLLLFCAVTTAWEEQPLVFNRVRFIEDTDKQSSIRFHGYSPDLVLIHAILRFSSPINQLHNALLIDQSSLPKYKKILIESTSKIPITTRSVKKILSYVTVAESLTDSDANDDGISDKLYELVRSATRFGIGFTSAISYDAVFLLDEYSTIWNEYNVMIFSKSMLTFKQTADGALSMVGEREVEEFTGLASITCDPALQTDQCLALSFGGVVANDRVYPTYRVLIDLDSPSNKLPIDLYLALLTRNNTSSKSLTLRLKHEEGEEETTLYLSSQYKYEMHQTNLIVLGVDLIHYFPRLEYSVTKKAFQLWHYESAKDDVFETQRNVKRFFPLLVFLLLVCLFRWATSYNYQILNYMIHFGEHAKTTHYFAYKQIFYELLALFVSLVAIIISYSVTDEPSSPNTDYQTRKTLITRVIVIDGLFNLYLIFVYRKPLKASYNHIRQYLTSTWSGNNSTTSVSPTGGCYNNKKGERVRDPGCRKKKEPKERTPLPLPYGEVFADICDRKMAERIHQEVEGVYHDPVIKQRTAISLSHNLLTMSIILAGLQMIFNFYSELNTIYLLLIVMFSLSCVYYEVKYMAISVFYLSLFYPPSCCSSSLQRRRNKWLILLIVIRAARLVFYIFSSYECMYVAYFNTINSTHARSVGDTYILSLLLVIGLVAVLMVTTAYDKYVDEILEDEIEEMLRKHTACLKKKIK